MSDYFEQLKDSASKYIAIEGLRKDQPNLDYNKFIKEAYARQIKIHGFAMTKPSFIAQCPFYSVDSSRWLNPIKYGCFDIWEPKKMLLKTVKSTQKDFMKFNIKVDLHSKNREEDIAKRKLLHAADQFYFMERDFTKLWEARGIKWRD